MSFYQRILRKSVPFLKEDETVLAAFRAKSNWHVSAALSGAVEGYSHLKDVQKDNEEINAQKANFPYAGLMIILLTHKRLLIWKRHLIWGTTKEFMGDYPINNILNVKLSNEKGLGDRISFTLSSSHKIKVYGRRKDGTKEFINQIKALLKK